MRSIALMARNAISDAIRYLTGKRPGWDDDPYAAVRSPIRRGPPDKRAAVSLEEPE